jgi:hypothetical protein
MVSDISIWAEELAGIHHQQMNDGQDDHEYEEETQILAHF